jgi:hypothetical protein
MPRIMNTSGSRDKTMSKQEYLSQPLRSLPELPVLRDSYCSQETVDRIVRWIHDNHPDRLMQLLREESGIRQATYYIAIKNIWAILKKEHLQEIEAMTPHLGAVDLLYEISRRLRNAYGLSDIPPRGKPLAPSPNGPFPPMLNAKVSPHNEKRGAAQEIVDVVLADFYDQRPDLWFAAGEGMQRNLGLLMSGAEYGPVLRNIILKRGFAEDVAHKFVQKGDLSSVAEACDFEFRVRIRAMCEIPFFNKLER